MKDNTTEYYRLPDTSQLLHYNHWEGTDQQDYTVSNSIVLLLTDLDVDSYVDLGHVLA